MIVSAIILPVDREPIKDGYSKMKVYIVIGLPESPSYYVISNVNCLRRHHVNKCSVLRGSEKNPLVATPGLKSMIMKYHLNSFSI